MSSIQTMYKHSCSPKQPLDSLGNRQKIFAPRPKRWISALQRTGDGVNVQNIQSGIRGVAGKFSRQKFGSRDMWAEHFSPRTGVLGGMRVRPTKVRVRLLVGALNVDPSSNCPYSINSLRHNQSQYLGCIWTWWYFESKRILQGDRVRLSHRSCFWSASVGLLCPFRHFTPRSWSTK